MSGHNKWSKIKNQKASTDKEKGKIYTLHARKIVMAVREGKGVDQAVEQARTASVPKHVIDRALSKSAAGVDLTEMLFEGLLLNGKISLIITAKTDNHVRLSSLVRNILEKHGGKMASLGALNYLFKKQAYIYVPKNEKNEEIIMESGASDFFEENDDIRIELDLDHLPGVTNFLKSKNLDIIDEEIVYTPVVEVVLNDYEKKHLNDVLSSLEEIDDVENVFTNEKN